MKPHKKHLWNVADAKGVSFGTTIEISILFVCHCGAYKQPKMREVKE